jgi:SAM-dependent methyltransferase
VAAAGRKWLFFFLYVSLKTETNSALNQTQTTDVFRDKGKQVEQMEAREKLYEMQREWFLPLYGFVSEEDLARFLSDKKIILDAGCGLGYKPAWLVRLAPDSTVIGIDISDRHPAKITRGRRVCPLRLRQQALPRH